MKFGQLLRTTAAELPEVESLFLSYKQLKKQLKNLPDKEDICREGAAEALSEHESRFVKTLTSTLQQMNEIFLEKEEDSVIRMERLQKGSTEASTREACKEKYRALVDFHGEVLLLMHWSILAYTATVKILKKHHKRTGLLVKAPELGDLLSQPFCSTELMTGIVRTAESCIRNLAERMKETARAKGECSHEDAVSNTPPLEDPEVDDIRRWPLRLNSYTLSYNEEPEGEGTSLSEDADPEESELAPPGFSAAQQSADTDAAFSPGVDMESWHFGGSCSSNGRAHVMRDASYQTWDPEGSVPGPPSSALSSCGLGAPPDTTEHVPRILRQTQVALTTWEQLKNTASTPSTVIAELNVLKRKRSSNLDTQTSSCA